MQVRRLGLCVAIALAAASAHASKVRYSCEVLEDGGPGSDYGTPGGLNNLGQAVGFSIFSFDVFGATSWALAGERSYLPAAVDGQHSMANAVNDAGLVVGYSGGYGADPTPAAWLDGVATPLALLPGGSIGAAAAVNSLGQIAGSSAIDASGLSHAVVWDSGAPVDLGTLGSSKQQGLRASAARAINDAGEAVGESVADKAGHLHAVRWSKNRKISDLGTLAGGVASQANDINLRGVIVGDSHFAGGQSYERRAVTWKSGVIAELARLPGHSTGSALAVNDGGAIVGVDSDTVEVNGVFFQGTAVLWRNAGAPAVDLNTVAKTCPIKNGSFVGQRLVDAADINAGGTILATLQGVDGLGGPHFKLVRLKPID